MRLLSALIKFKQAYLELDKEWDIAGDDCFVGMKGEYLYPFHLSFDKLQVCKWVDAFVNEATSILPDEVPNPTVVCDGTNYNYDDTKQVLKLKDNLDIYGYPEPMVPFHRKSVQKFLFNYKKYLEDDIDLDKVTDMQIYILYMQVLNIGERMNWK